ncbi:MAG: hypothetical protein R2941_09660 [Desulfobacterales bacterium]
MFNTNDFDKGWQDGLAQARKGEKKNYSHFGLVPTLRVGMR